MACNGLKKVRTAVGALLATLALTGCTIPIINVEVPFEMPDLSGVKLPSFDLDVESWPIPEVKLPIGIRTSVDEARQSVLTGKASTLSDGALVKPGYLTVGVKTVTSSAPLCVVDEGGYLYGLDVDLGAALASEMGLMVRYVPIVDGSSLGTECDIIMNGKSDNSDGIAIAGVYVQSASSFFYKGSPTVVAPTDLGGKSVGLQDGSISQTILNRTGLKMSQKTYANLNEAFDALSAGEVDYVLCDAYPGAYLATLRPGISFAGALEAPESSGVAALQSNAELVGAVQAAFDAISNNGIFEGVRSRWVGTMPTLTVNSQIQNVPAGDANASETSPELSTEDGQESDDSIAVTEVPDESE